MSVRDRCKFARVHGRRETLDDVIARVDFHQCSGVFTDGVLKVSRMGSIRGAHFAQHGPGAGHDVWDSKRVSNLDEFTSGYRHLSALGEGVENQHYGCGVVVDDRCSFGARHLADQPFNMRISVAAFSIGEVVF